MVDGHPTVKFAYINWIGSDVSMMKKAKTATHKGVNFTLYLINYFSYIRPLTNDLHLSMLSLLFLKLMK